MDHVTSQQEFFVCPLGSTRRYYLVINMPDLFLDLYNALLMLNLCLNLFNTRKNHDSQVGYALHKLCENKGFHLPYSSA